HRNKCQLASHCNPPLIDHRGAAGPRGERPNLSQKQVPTNRCLAPVATLVASARAMGGNRCPEQVPGTRRRLKTGVWNLFAFTGARASESIGTTRESGETLWPPWRSRGSGWG